MSRGADRQDIFSDDHDRTHFERLLGEATDSFTIGVHAYCLMSNHFHVLVHCQDDDLSAAMQHVCGNHARAYNRRHGRSGTIFGDRFKSVPITTERPTETAFDDTLGQEPPRAEASPKGTRRRQT